MKRRNADCGKMRRPVKRNKIPDSIYSSTVLYLKFLLLWSMVILADFILEFRFEFLWPFWMLLRSVYDSFKYQGLAFSVFFVCIALTSDMICFFFIPVQWVFFAASTYVWVQYVWHTDKGVCLPTMILCSVFVYMEGAVRLRDLRHMPAHVDLCRPFAAHCIGYPVVTLGFGLKSYVGHHIRIRRQKQVAKENSFYMQLLQEALPPSEQNVSAIKESTTDKSSIETNVSDKQQHMNGNAVHINSHLNSNHNSNNSTSNSNANSSKSNFNHKKADSNSKSQNNTPLISSSNYNSNDATATCMPCVGDNVVPSQVNSIASVKASQNNLYHPNNIYTSSSSPPLSSCVTSNNANKQHAHTNGIVSSSHSTILQSDAQQTECDFPQPERNVKGSKSNTSKQEKRESTNTPREENRRKNRNKDKESNKESSVIKEKEIKESTIVHKDNKESNHSQKERDSSSNVYKEKESQRDSYKDVNKEKEMENHSNSKEKESHSNTKEKESHSNIREKEPHSNIREKESHSSIKEKESHSNIREKESHSSIKEKETYNNSKDKESHSNVKEKESHREKESRREKERDKEKEELHQKYMEHKENCERQIRQLRAEITQLRTQNEQLGARANAARAAERAAISSVERRVNEERRRSEGCRQRRAALEAEVTTLRQQIQQARERGQRLERELQNAEHQVSTMENKMRENSPEAWRTAFNTLRDRAQQLERSLSAETRIKMDLFSAVGEAKRLSGLREGVIRNQEKEIEELKGKIAQMLAVMPSDPFPQPSYHMQVTHGHPHQHSHPSPPSVNPLSNLDPNATAYTPKSVNQTTIKG